MGRRRAILSQQKAQVLLESIPAETIRVLCVELHLSNCHWSASNSFDSIWKPGRECYWMDKGSYWSNQKQDDRRLTGSLISWLIKPFLRFQQGHILNLRYWLSKLSVSPLSKATAGVAFRQACAKLAFLTTSACERRLLIGSYCRGR